MRHAPFYSTPAAREIRRALDALASRDIQAAQVAARLGWTPQMIAMLKGGSAKVPLKRADDLAKALEINPAQFFTLCVASYHPQLKRMMK